MVWLALSKLTTTTQLTIHSSAVVGDRSNVVVVVVASRISGRGVKQVVLVLLLMVLTRLSRPTQCVQVRGRLIGGGGAGGRM